MNCPWCGKEMLPGKMWVWGNGGLTFELADREYTKTERFFGDNKRNIAVTEKLFTKKLADAFHCKTCKKFIFDGWME